MHQRVVDVIPRLRMRFAFEHVQDVLHVCISKRAVIEILKLRRAAVLARQVTENSNRYVEDVRAAQHLHCIITMFSRYHYNQRHQGPKRNKPACML